MYSCSITYIVTYPDAMLTLAIIIRAYAIGDEDNYLKIKNTAKKKK